MINFVTSPASCTRLFCSKRPRWRRRILKHYPHRPTTKMSHGCPQPSIVTRHVGLGFSAKKTPAPAVAGTGSLRRWGSTSQAAAAAQLISINHFTCLFHVIRESHTQESGAGTKAPFYVYTPRARMRWKHSVGRRGPREKASSILTSSARKSTVSHENLSLFLRLAPS